MVNVANLIQKRRATAHRIADVHFERRTNDGVLDCTCGAEMLASEFAAHRSEAGDPPGILRSPDALCHEASAWRRSAL